MTSLGASTRVQGICAHSAVWHEDWDAKPLHSARGKIRETGPALEKSQFKRDMTSKEMNRKSCLVWNTEGCRTHENLQDIRKGKVEAGRGRGGASL